MPKSRKKSISESTQQEYIACDLGFSLFQKEFKNLSDEQFKKISDTITKIQGMTWQQVYDQSTKNPKQKTGLNWEVIEGQKTFDGKTIASIRVSNKFRARVCRDRRWMRFISLHPDHDSVYK